MFPQITRAQGGKEGARKEERKNERKENKRKPPKIRQTRKARKKD